jgi:gluconokinase
MVAVVMGVSGCGKTTVGKQVASRLNLPFFDGDDFHPAANVARMKAGIPLGDEERRPWLDILAARIAEWNRTGGVILACSALRESYRELLRGNQGTAVRFVHLHGPRELIAERMARRTGHFMPVGLLESQYATLEPPADAVSVSVALPRNEVVQRIVEALKEYYAAV